MSMPSTISYCRRLSVRCACGTTTLTSAGVLGPSSLAAKPSAANTAPYMPSSRSSSRAFAVLSTGASAGASAATCSAAGARSGSTHHGLSGAPPAIQASRSRPSAITP